MNPARLFRPLQFNEQLFKNASSSGYVLANQSNALASTDGPFSGQQVNAAFYPLVEINPHWPSDQKAANSDFGVLTKSLQFLKVIK